MYISIRQNWPGIWDANLFEQNRNLHTNRTNVVNIRHRSKWSSNMVPFELQNHNGRNSNMKCQLVYSHNCCLLYKIFPALLAPTTYVYRLKANAEQIQPLIMLIITLTLYSTLIPLRIREWNLHSIICFVKQRTAVSIIPLH